MHTRWVHTKHNLINSQILPFQQIFKSVLKITHTYIRGQTHYPNYSIITNITRGETILCLILLFTNQLLELFNMSQSPDLRLPFVTKVCQFMQTPLEEHWRDVKRILRYLVALWTMLSNLLLLLSWFSLFFVMLTWQMTSMIKDLHLGFVYSLEITLFLGVPRSNQWWHV